MRPVWLLGLEGGKGEAKAEEEGGELGNVETGGDERREIHEGGG